MPGLGHSLPDWSGHTTWVRTSSRVHLASPSLFLSLHTCSPLPTHPSPWGRSRRLGQHPPQTGTPSLTQWHAHRLRSCPAIGVPIAETPWASVRGLCRNERPPARSGELGLLMAPHSQGQGGRHSTAPPPTFTFRPRQRNQNRLLSCGFRSLEGSESWPGDGLQAGSLRAAAQAPGWPSLGRSSSSSVGRSLDYGS